MGLLKLTSDGKLALKSASGTKEIDFRPSCKDVLLLIDTSGSMAGDKIDQAKNGAIDFVSTVHIQGCATALAVFADRAAMVCDATLDVAAFQNKLKRLEVGIVGGSTNLAAGLQLAGKFKSLNAVVVVTDGHANSDREALEAAESLKRRGIDILCIGTDDADRAFLAKLATRADLAIHVKAAQLRSSFSEASRLLLGDSK